MYDIAIIGAGPAGSTLARLLGKKYKVLLVDKRRLDVDPAEDKLVKCCGGLVAPDAQKVLAELGLGLPAKVLVGPQLFAVRTIDLTQNLERYYQRFYINIDREQFDRWLVSLVPDAVDMRFGLMYRGFERERDGFLVRLAQGSQEFTERARILVGADGGSSQVRRHAFPAATPVNRYIAVQEWFKVKEPLPYFTAIFDPELTDFYAWTIPKEDQLLIGAALRPGPDANTKFERLKVKLQGFGLTWSERIKREGAFIVRPVKTDQAFAGGDGVALLGEAGGWISPSSAEGLSYALASAIYLAKSLQPGLGGAVQRYAAKCAALRRNLRVKNLKSPAMYNAKLRRLVMQSGLQSVNVPGAGERITDQLIR